MRRFEIARVSLPAKETRPPCDVRMLSCSFSLLDTFFLAASTHSSSPQALSLSCLVPDAQVSLEEDAGPTHRRLSYPEVVPLSDFYNSWIVTDLPTGLLLGELGTSPALSERAFHDDAAHWAKGEAHVAPPNASPPCAAGGLTTVTSIPFHCSRHFFSHSHRSKLSRCVRSYSFFNANLLLPRLFFSKPISLLLTTLFLTSKHPLLLYYFLSFHWMFTM